MKILWISLRAPYDQVRHAGGKIHNYYLKHLLRNSDYDIKLITFCKKDEIDKVIDDHKRYGLSSDVYIWDTPVHAKIQRGIAKRNPFSRFGGATTYFYWEKIKSSIKKLKYTPDIIILHWTEILLFQPKIKKYFPAAQIVSIEEDVLFLNFQRQFERCDKKIKKLFLKRRFDRLRSSEIKNLKKCDLVILNNPKDEKLVNDCGVHNTWHWAPFFQNLHDINSYKNETKDILYYGAMSRPENHQSVMHFIHNIMPFIEDKEARFIVVGNGPQEELLKYKSARIVITGFVEDPKVYFENAICLCAPLVLGAGVKIKILEAMSAGITVLTNKIGIEGIPAKNNCEYIFCETDDEFIKSINNILKGVIDVRTIGYNAREFIDKNYNCENSAKEFAIRLKNVMNPI